MYCGKMRPVKRGRSKLKPEERENIKVISGHNNSGAHIFPDPHRLAAYSLSLVVVDSRPWPTIITTHPFCTSRCRYALDAEEG